METASPGLDIGHILARDSETVFGKTEHMLMGLSIVELATAAENAASLAEIESLLREATFRLMDDLPRGDERNALQAIYNSLAARLPA